MGEEGNIPLFAPFLFTFILMQVKFIFCALFFLAFGAALSLNIVGSRSGVGFWDKIWDDLEEHIKQIGSDSTTINSTASSLDVSL